MPATNEPQWTSGVIAFFGRAFIVLAITLHALTPSFLHPLFSKSTDIQPSSPHGDLSYLTGVHGVAAAMVFAHHWAHGSYPGLDHAWGDPQQIP